MGWILAFYFSKKTSVRIFLRDLSAAVCAAVHIAATARRNRPSAETKHYTIVTRGPERPGA
jgi:hypothetical protein